MSKIKTVMRPITNQYQSTCKICDTSVEIGKFMYKYDPYAVYKDFEAITKNESLNCIFVCEDCHTDDSWKPVASPNNPKMPLQRWDRSLGPSHCAELQRNMECNAEAQLLGVDLSVDDVNYNVAAQELGVSATKLRQMAKDGEIPSHKIQGSVRSTYLRRSEFPLILAALARR